MCLFSVHLCRDDLFNNSHVVQEHCVISCWLSSPEACRLHFRRRSLPWRRPWMTRIPAYRQSLTQPLSKSSRKRLPWQGTDGPLNGTLPPRPQDALGKRKSTFTTTSVMRAGCAARTPGQCTTSVMCQHSCWGPRVFPTPTTWKNFLLN